MASHCLFLVHSLCWWTNPPFFLCRSPNVHSKFPICPCKKKNRDKHWATESLGVDCFMSGELFAKTIHCFPPGLTPKRHPQGDKVVPRGYVWWSIHHIVTVCGWFDISTLNPTIESFFVKDMLDHVGCFHVSYKVGPPNAISWFIVPINYSYIYHKP